LPLGQGAGEHSAAQVQAAFEGTRRNFDAGLLAAVLRGPIAFFSRLNPLGSPPSDRLGARVARLLTTPGPVRDRLADNLYVPNDPEQALGRLEKAFRLVTEAGPVLDRIKEAAKASRIPKGSPETLTAAAVETGVISAQEAALVRAAAAAREDAIQVDSFTLAEYQRREPLDAEPEAVAAR